MPAGIDYLAAVPDPEALFEEISNLDSDRLFGLRQAVTWLVGFEFERTRTTVKVRGSAVCQLETAMA